ncbi:unnamed protein product [Adineta ricciae]|uniref:BRCT domain-containing protein n=1 Tax=Adineta ricciae TaxID=249248 RepID=A0A815PYK0_ADIRI|nr:unnamed protein product [Adineta ricciae]
MSFQVETDNTLGHKYLVDFKRHRSTCSIDGCLSRAQRNSFCAKHLQAYIQPTEAKRLMNKKTSHRNFPTKKRLVMKKKSTQLNPWSTSTSAESASTNTNINVHQIKQIFSKFHHNLTNEIDDDMKSENSIEYDYTNPIPTPISNHHKQRHVSIATIYLQEEQWHQLELFIKHFSSYASLSNNMNINSSTTHLLVDDSSNPLRCIFSKKIFQAAARRIFIVSIRWIEECLLRNEIVDETRFEIHGDHSMSTMHLARRCSTLPLFSPAIGFVINCASFQRTITRNELAELAVLSGATVFEREQHQVTKSQVKLLIVLVDPNADRSRLENQYRSWRHNVKFLTPGYLLKSIIYQKQQPYEDFELL